MVRRKKKEEFSGREQRTEKQKLKKKIAKFRKCLSLLFAYIYLNKSGKQPKQCLQPIKYACGGKMYMINV